MPSKLFDRFQGVSSIGVVSKAVSSSRNERVKDEDDQLATMVKKLRPQDPWLSLYFPQLTIAIDDLRGSLSRQGFLKQKPHTV